MVAAFASVLQSLPTSLLIASLLAVAALPVTSAGRELTESSFNPTIKEGVWLIEYFSPYCHHCRDFAPTWDSLVEYVDSQENAGINLARVDCVREGDLCDASNIRGYPALKLYADGKETSEYKGERDLESLKTLVASSARQPAVEREVSQSHANPDGQVISLDPSNFADTLSKGPAFVKFFAPWCGHCKKLAPTWMLFASKMKERVTVAEVNCEAHKKLCSQEKIQGYPMIFFYQGGHNIDYTGRRTLEAMEHFAEEVLAPPIKEIKYTELGALHEQKDVTFVLVHDKADEALVSRIEDASTPLHGSPQIHSLRKSDEALKRLSLSTRQHVPVLVSLKDHAVTPFETFAISHETPQQRITDWLLRHSLPILSELSSDNFQRIMGSTSPPGVTSSKLIVLGALDGGIPRQRETLHNIALSWHRSQRAKEPVQIIFSWMDREEWSSWLKSAYGIQPRAARPSVVLVDHGRLLYWDQASDKQPIELDASRIFAAIDDVLTGAIRPKYSENFAERTARRVSYWLEEMVVFVSYSPFKAVMIAGAFIVVLFLGLKRCLGEDPRRTPLYNSKSATRLD